MREKYVAFSPPCLGDDEIAEVTSALRSGWITTGPRVKRFEQEFGAFIGAQGALAVSSGTDAMLVSLAALGIGSGDAVLTTTMTFCSTVHVIEHLGARPVLVDVEPDTLNIDPAKVDEALERARAQGLRVRAIMPVHLYGHPCEMDSLIDLAERDGAHIVEDAAHALPAAYRGRAVGTIGTLTAFSFYATKNLTTAEGGMLTGPPNLIQQARLWSLHGMSGDAWKRYSAEGSWYYEVVLPGFKCNMTDIQAAIGLHQLRKLPKFEMNRREVVRRYNKAFSELPELQIPVERSEVHHAWHLYVLRLNLETLSIDRARFIEELNARGIGTSVHFIPVHLHPFYREKYGFTPEDFPIAYREYRRIISLPLHPGMTDEDVSQVIEAVRDVVRRFKR